MSRNRRSGIGAKYVIIYVGVAALAGLLLQGPKLSETPPEITRDDPLPPHQVERIVKIGLAHQDRYKVDLNADPSITKAQCKVLLSAYAHEAKANGQVVVWKYSSAMKELRPWCVDNQDGSSVIFNDFMFDGTITRD